MIFRFDDISLNSDIPEVEKMIDYIKWKGHDVILGISPLTNSKAEKGRVFPKIHSAYSDNTIFYQMNQAGIPEIKRKCIMAGHGLVHADHRLLSRETQELSILTSCSLIGAKMFIPPFNKWNQDTEAVCSKHDIELIKLEDGWLSCEHNDFKEHEKWYLHPYAFGYDKLIQWIG